MPKVGLSLGSSFEKLFHKDPDPSKLHIFDCLCFPWLRPYASHKLNPKSSPCVFLSYSLTQSAFLCFDPILHKIFVSRHVKFVENVFPCTSLPPSSYKTRENSNFWKNGKIVISVKTRNFSRSRMMKPISPLESSHEI